MQPARSEATSTHDPPGVTRRALLLLLVATVIIRLAILSRLSGNLADDPDQYKAIAQSLVARGNLGYWFPSAYRPPLYPLLIAPCVALGEHAELAIGGLQLVLGVVTVGLTVRLGTMWGLQRWSLLAGAFVACDPILLNQSSLVMTETTATLLAAAALAALTSLGDRPTVLRAVAGGLMLALASLCRPTFLPWAAVVTLVLLWQVSITWPRRFLLAGSLCVALAAGLAPWMIRNQRLLGRPIATTTHGGYTFYLANNASFYRWLRAGGPAVWQVTEEVWSLDSFADPRELARDQRAYDLAWRAIRAEPAMFAWSCLVRIGYLWRPLPQRLVHNEGPIARTSRWIVAGWYSGVYLLAAAGIWRLGRGMVRLPWIWGLTLVGCITLIHTFYWSNMRMRAPAMPVVALAAAVGAARSRRLQHAPQQKD